MERDFTLFGVDFGWLYGWVEPLWLLWLMALFLALVVWVFRPSRKREFEQYGRIPLEDEPDPGHGGGKES